MKVKRFLPDNENSKCDICNWEIGLGYKLPDKRQICSDCLVYLISGDNDTFEITTINEV